MPAHYAHATCQHLFPPVSSEDARRCGSPALRGESFCYYHHPDRKPVANPYARRSRRGFNLPAPTNRQTLNSALSEVITRLAANTLDVHRASLLLYSLQIASHTLPPATP